MSLKREMPLSLAREEAFRSEICGRLSLPRKDMDALFASGKACSIWPKSHTQQGIVLKILAQEFGRWVEVNRLMRVAHSAAVHSVVHCLRERGWPIWNSKGQRIVRDGVVCCVSKYCLRFNEEGRA